MENSRQGSRFHGAPNPIFPTLPASFKAKVDFGLDFHLAGAEAVPPRLVWLIIPSFLSWVLKVCFFNRSATVGQGDDWQLLILLSNGILSLMPCGFRIVEGATPRRWRLQS